MSHVTFPTGGVTILQALYTAHPDLVHGDEEARRLLHRWGAETMVARLGDSRWGVKARSAHDPQGKDAIAYQHEPAPPGASTGGRFDVWDVQNGETRALVVRAGDPPNHLAIHDQWFIVVPAVDHLVGVPTPPPPPTGQPYPDEQTWWPQVFEPAVGACYAQAGKAYPDNPAAFRWAARTAYDIATGLTKEASLAKHLAELRHALGLD
jgi:hypothetical protein